MYRQVINLVHPSQKDNKALKSITYMGIPSLNFSSFLKNLDLDIVLKTANVLGRFIRRIVKTMRMKKSEVYRVI